MPKPVRFVPTSKMAENAARGLDLRAKHGRGGTHVGVARAEQLIAREPLEPKDIKSMYSYFARHAVDKQGRNWADPARPSAGYIAWLLWGGDEGKMWVDEKRKMLD
ncbi:hypothetical protein SCH01S_48_00580 [Sphingomonas changbaiensis NBRC 104936]|uniref:Uncharacterized protein n=1 Tax=Sphingomonas changbaiensis NBRC 104936 TaxID=1219043 RepID=A0A0E9MTG0_9SPHN|nr:hypothetical protein [Sphingomonas changbaiensis]GAO40400.1 hypothetical protein SCH01S_48_00580 [Sphingomonas changbaiensis NBRC 104936]